MRMLGKQAGIVGDAGARHALGNAAVEIERGRHRGGRLDDGAEEAQLLVARGEARDEAAQFGRAADALEAGAALELRAEREPLDVPALDLRVARRKQQDLAMLALGGREHQDGAGLLDDAGQPGEIRVLLEARPDRGRGVDRVGSVEHGDPGLQRRKHARAPLAEHFGLERESARRAPVARRRENLRVEQGRRRKRRQRTRHQAAAIDHLRPLRSRRATESIQAAMTAVDQLLKTGPSLVTWPILRPGRGIALAVEVEAGARLGGELRPAADIVADQIVHETLSARRGGSSRAAGRRSRGCAARIATSAAPSIVQWPLL
jgi:hypothetical protein